MEERGAKNELEKQREIKIVSDLQPIIPQQRHILMGQDMSIHDRLREDRKSVCVCVCVLCLVFSKQYTNKEVSMW